MKSFEGTKQTLSPWARAGAVLLVLVYSGFMGWGLYMQLVQGKPVGDKPVSDVTLIAIAGSIELVMLFLAWVAFKTSLRVSADEQGIHFSYLPFIRKRTFVWANLEYAWVRDYNPLRNYGGWGYHTVRKSKAFNLSGHTGIQMITRDGRHLLVGITDREEFDSILRNYGFGEPAPK